MPVDLSASFYAQYQKVRKQAEDAEGRGAWREAAASYQQAANYMRQYAQSTHDGKVRAQRLERAAALEQHALRLRQSPQSSGNAAPTEARRDSASEEASDQNDIESEIIGLIETTTIKWDDIGGLDDTKQAIKSAYGLAMARKPKGIEISSWRNILLFGPPGTGKTLLAAATAGSLEATFFNVKVSNLLSKYFGESTKLVSSLYSVAKRYSPSVIFLDEFESLTPPRGSGESGAERRIVSTFLAELDGLATKDDDRFLLTMGATNVPWLIDSAMLSRFQKRIYVPLPDETARLSILKINIQRTGHKSLLSLEELAQRTEGYSGREINQLCQTAVAHMTARANPDLTKLVDQGRKAIEGYEIKVESLNESDFKIAFEQVHPISTPETLRQYNEWLKQVDA
ncbi:MAG: ATP-binding protein [Chloroflexota bacterium]